MFVALGVGASAIGAVVRAYSYELGKIAGLAIIVMGLHFLGLTPIALLMREKRFGGRQACRIVGRLCDGARLCLWLDALHRADPQPPSWRSRGQKGASLAARACCRSIRSVSACLLCGGTGRRGVRRFSRPFSRASRNGRKDDGRAARARRHSLPLRLGHRLWRLADRDLSRTRQAGDLRPRPRQGKLSSARRR